MHPACSTYYGSTYYGSTYYGYTYYGAPVGWLDEARLEERGAEQVGHSGLLGVALTRLGLGPGQA